MNQKGFTLIELMIVIAIIAIIAAIAIPNLLEARKAANESSAVSALRTLGTTQQLYRDTDKDANGVSDYAGNLTNLGEQDLIDEVLSGGAKSGFHFAMVGTEFAWSATANPQDPSTGNRYFFVNEKGVIYYNTTAADSNDTPVGK